MKLCNSSGDGILVSMSVTSVSQPVLQGLIYASLQILINVIVCIYITEAGKITFIH
jgi:membrane protein required for beta-lactamase induction